MQSRASKLAQHLCTTGLILFFCDRVRAQDINIDCDDPAAVAGAGIPPALFSAAAPPSAIDMWNGVAPGAAAGVALVDTAGLPVLATCGHTGGFAFSFNNAGTAGADELLLDDLQCVPGGGVTWTIGPLLPGTYDVYSYAWAPDNPLGFLTSVAVAGGVPGAIVVGGAAFPAGGPPYATPAHYALHSVVVPAGGAIMVTFTAAAGFGSVNGIQLRRHPPGPPPPTRYCSAGTTTNGCLASITADNNPSVTFANPCNLTVASVEGQKSGIIFYGIAGPAASNWNGVSLLCVKAPLQRTGTQNSGGNAGLCDGTLVLDWNAYQTANPTALGNPFAVGNTVNAQGWFRDPPAPKTTNMSNAVQMICVP